ncbi:hypothetical protein LIER_33076 [Lithospermum erythrorhizon]|uniref:Bifunctional inhibitor/plant lipid transfer protein/seed storage helical domain-containing protein n=1 Tax=Lithospermum erythrorhizon TaxID=34254 RepID=A0AAV3RVN2_LITER
MAKGLLILLLSATLAVVLVSDAASISTTTEVAELAERCQQQQQQINACQRYLIDSSQCSSSGRSSYSNERGDWREEFPRCCEQLEQIDEQCRCEAIKQVAQQQHQQLQGREKEEMLQTAQSLPNLCRISPQRCDIQRRGQY